MLWEMKGGDSKLGKGKKCGKCKKLILDPDFVAHFKQCEGSPLAEIIAEKLQVPLTKQVREKIA
jgi:hypothetical protein